MHETGPLGGVPPGSTGLPSRARSIPSLAAAVAAALLLVAGCGSGPVEVRVPQPQPRAARACARLHERLPETLEGQPRRETRPPSRLVTAWGDPPIVVRCGVREPAALRRSSLLTAVNGVEWFAETERSPRRFTAVHRAARVQLLLPGEYGPPAGFLVDLAAPIKKSVPKRS